MTTKEFKQLTIPQYKDRIQDVPIIINMLTGDGRPRVSTDLSKLQKMAVTAGVRLPSSVAGENK